MFVVPLPAGWYMSGVAVTGIYTFVNPDKMSTTTDVSDLVESPKEGTPIFLQTRAAQCIAGVFVWVALFLTCQQVLIIIGNSLMMCHHGIECYQWYKMVLLRLTFLDLSALEVVHKSDGTEVDSADSFYCTHLCHIFLDFTVVLQQRELLCLFLHCARLLWGICYI